MGSNQGSLSLADVSSSLRGGIDISIRVFSTVVPLNWVLEGPIHTTRERLGEKWKLRTKVPRQS